MTAEEVGTLKEGDVIYWATGKEHFKGVFVKFTGTVLDLRLMLVRSDSGLEDEILHPFLTSEEIYNRQMTIKTNRSIRPQKVKSSIVKKETISDDNTDEENLSEALSDEIDSKIQDFVDRSPKLITKPVVPVITGPVNKDNLVKASGHRDYVGGVTPNLKTLQGLLLLDGIHIERDKAKWVRYHLILADGTSDQFDFSGKVFELYNIYLDGGIDAILKLKK